MAFCPWWRDYGNNYRPLPLFLCLLVFMGPSCVTLLIVPGTSVCFLPSSRFFSLRGSSRWAGHYLHIPRRCFPGDETCDCVVVFCVLSVEGNDWLGFCCVDVKVCLGKWGCKNSCFFTFFFLLSLSRWTSVNTGGHRGIHAAHPSYFYK